MLVFAWTGLTGLGLSPEQLLEVQGGGLLLLLRNWIGEGGIQLLSFVAAYISGACAAGPVSRLGARAPSLVADAAGIRLHRSFGPGAITWENVADIRLEGRRPARLVITLKRRFWASEKPFTSKQVHMNLVEIGCSYRRANESIRRMRRWKRESEIIRVQLV